MNLSGSSTPTGVFGGLKKLEAPAPKRLDIAGPDGNKTPESFSSVLQNALAGVNDLQIQADQRIQALVRGDVQNLHEAVIAMERAEMALSFTIAVRNKLVEAYQEIMRMQV